MANFCETSSTLYKSRQRALSLTLGVACSIPVTSTMALAHGSMPTAPSGSWQSQGTGGSNSHVITGMTGLGSNHHTTLVHTANTQANAGTGGVLNLASSSLSFLAGNLANFSNMTINVGGRTETVNLNTKLTGAEVVAVEQVLSGAGQTIKLASNGVADGGSVSLNSNLLTALDNSVGGSISSLTIAKGVQVVDSLNVLSLSGGLSNYGSILTAAGTSGSSDTISAGTILNAAGGAIGSYGGGGGLVGADPMLSATASVTNNGSIFSAGNLTVTAPVVYNVASHGSAATMSAANNVNINTQSLTNSGTISAAAGNVNLASTAGLNVTGTGGTIQANNGNINLTSGNADIDVNGGNMLSLQANFNAGTGNINADLGQISGAVNTTGNNVQVIANTQDLRVGSTDATGDPLFANTSTITISTGNANNTGNPDLTIVSGKNINADGTGGPLDLSTAGATGGNLTLIAGAKFTGTELTGVTVTGGSSTGGLIDLTGGNGGAAGGVASISANGTGAGAGNIQMIAYAGSVSGSGAILTPTSIPITATGVTTNGNVTIIAGAKTGTAISTGAISANNVNLDVAAPTITKASGTSGVNFVAAGTQQNPTTNFFGPAKTGNTGSITVGNVSTTGVLSILTGASATVVNGASDLDLGKVTVGTTGGFSATTTSGNIIVNSPITAGSFTATTTSGDITVNGTIAVAKTGAFTASTSSGDILISNTISGGTTNLTSNSGTINTASPGSVNTTTLNLDPVVGTTDTLTTNVSTLNIVTGGPSVVINQQNAVATKAANTLNVASASLGGTGTLTINSSGQINTTGLISTNNENVTLTTSLKGGINIGGIDSIGTGTFTVANLAGKLTESKGFNLTGDTVIVNSGTSFGSKSLPFITNGATELDVNLTGSAAAKNVAYVSDMNTGTLLFQGNQGVATPAGGSLFLTSGAGALQVANANFNKVSITGTVASGAGIDFSSATGILGNLSKGSTFTVVSPSAITDSSGAIINGNTVTLTGAAGVGQTGLNPPILVNSPVVVANSSQGNVFFSDSAAATVSGSASLGGTYSATDTFLATALLPNGLTVGKSILAQTIDLTTNTNASSIAITGILGNANTLAINAVSDLNITTKGAIEASQITLDALTTGLTGLVTTGGKITALGPLANVLIEARGNGVATTNAITIGQAITGLVITLKVQGSGDVGGIAVNAAVGGAATQSTTIIDGVGGGTDGGAITGKGVIGGQQVALTAFGAIGTLKAPLATAAVVLSVNSGTPANTGGTFITQKGNLNLSDVNTDTLLVKVTGNTDVTGTVTATGTVVGTVVTDAVNLTSSGTTVIDGTINDTGAALTGGPVLITSSGAFSTNGASSITSANQPVSIAAKTTANIFGSVAVNTLNLTTGGVLNIGTLTGTGPIGSLLDGTDNITSKGAINVVGSIGASGTPDILNISSTGAITIGVPATTAAIFGTGQMTGVTIANYGSANGSITYNATGAGNAFSNFGTVGNGGGASPFTDVIVINAPKGSIFSSANSLIDAGTLALTAGVNATVNLGSNGAVAPPPTITSAAIKGALQVNGVTGNFAVGGATAGSVTAGSVNIQYANANSTNNNTITLNNIATTTGNLVVASNAEFLTVSAGSSLTTLAGNITLQNTNGSLANAKITIDDGVIIHGSGAKSNLNEGNVSIFMGPAGFIPAIGTPPVAGVTVTGTVTFASSSPVGGNTISIVGTGNTLTGTGRNLAFNEANYAVTSITVGSVTGGVAITADPPASATANLVSQGALNAFVVPVVASNAISSALAAPDLATSIGATIAPSGLSIASIANPLSTTPNMAYSGVSAGFLSSLDNSATAQNAIVAGSSSNSVAQCSADVVSGGVSGIIGPNVDRKLTGGVSNTSHQTLDRGPLLLSPEQNTVVDTPFGSVSVAAGSVVLIVSSGQGLAVYNLHDTHKNAVTVRNGDGTIALTPGRSAVIAKSSVKSFEEVNPAPFVAYRKVGSSDASGQTKLYQADFDMISMVRGLPAIKHLIASDNAVTRKTMSNMLKTSAILMQLSQSSEPYALYLTPAVTASALASNSVQ